jgi:5'-nucleotidase
VPIEGATGESYKVRAADAGAVLTVTVTAGAEGYANGVATSAGKTVAKLPGHVNGNLAKTFLVGSNTVAYTVTVTAQDGVVPGGTVTIYDGFRAVQTVQLDANGTATVTLTGLSRGLHLITSQYTGSAQVETSVGLPDLLLVF